MAYDSIIQTGSFIANGKSKVLELRSGVDKIVIENQTEWAASNLNHGYRYTWYIDNGTGALKEFHPAADHTSAVELISDAFRYVDSANYFDGAETAIIDATNAVNPVYNVASTAALEDGMIVRAVRTDQKNLNGLDFSIEIVDATHFKLSNALATAPGVTAGGNGAFKVVGLDVSSYNLFSPSYRVIADISKAAKAVVTTLADHDFFVGQLVKFKVGEDFGMTQLDDLTGVVVNSTHNTFTVDIDTTGFTAYKFPLFNNVTFDYAMVFPVGDGKTSISQIAPSAAENKGYIGMILSPGPAMPAGSAGDVIRWTAYKSGLVDDE